MKRNIECEGHIGIPNQTCHIFFRSRKVLIIWADPYNMQIRKNWTAGLGSLIFPPRKERLQSMHAHKNQITLWFKVTPSHSSMTVGCYSIISTYTIYLRPRCPQSCSSRVYCSFDRRVIYACWSMFLKFEQEQILSNMH